MIAKPTVDVLMQDEEKPAKGSLLELLSQQPKETWLETNTEFPDYKYVPIKKVRSLLRTLFGTRHRIETLREGYIAGSVFVTVRVHFWDYDNNEMSSWDGIGGCEIAGKSVKSALPIAESEAIKDACGIWQLFGSELNKNTGTDKSKLPADKKWLDLQTLFDEVKDKVDKEDIPIVENIIANRIEKERIKTNYKLNRLKKLAAAKPKTKKFNAKEQML